MKLVGASVEVSRKVHALACDHLVKNWTLILKKKTSSVYDCTVEDVE